MGPYQQLSVLIAIVNKVPRTDVDRRLDALLVALGFRSGAVVFLSP